ncbi:Galactose-3-O-sulfotransferase [Branchiostoma belcheri]|nr:Galactose-3-O-sulfotransferase [Branchiostoma belcheri]
MATVSKSVVVFLTFQAIFLFLTILWSHQTTKVSTKHLSDKFLVNNRSELTALGHDGSLPTLPQSSKSDSATREATRGATVGQDGSLSKLPNNVSYFVTTTDTECNSTSPVTNFVFIKVHKTASGSTFMLLARFGRNHEMTICYPAKRSKAHHKQLSYPSGKLIKKDCNPAFGRNYTLLIHHSIMNKLAMDSIMQPGTKYIGIMREPLSHFRSIFFWEQRVLRHSKNPLARFLDMNENFTLGRTKPFSKHRNFQAHYLGFPTNLMASNDANQLYDTISVSQSGTPPPGVECQSRCLSTVCGYVIGWTVASWYSIVLITEYWEESLVLLKRNFCWTLFDILHTTRKLHKLKTRKEHVTLTDKQKDTHRKMSNIDYMMYDYFNNTFWRSVSEEGPDFWEEVAYYKTLNYEVNQHCNSAGHKQEKVFSAGKWGQEFTINSSFCKEMQKWGEGKWAVSCREVVDRQNEAFVKMNQTQPVE